MEVQDSHLSLHTAPELGICLNCFILNRTETSSCIHDTDGQAAYALCCGCSCLCQEKEIQFLRQQTSSTVNSWWLRGHSFHKTSFLSGTSPLMFVVVVVVVDRFYAALFSVLKQPHCALVVFLNVHQSGILTVLFSFYTAGAMWDCCCLSTVCGHHITMPLHASLYMSATSNFQLNLLANVTRVSLAKWNLVTLGIYPFQHGRSTSPVHPRFHGVHCDYHVFLTSHRILWEHTWHTGHLGQGTWQQNPGKESPGWRH